MCFFMLSELADGRRLVGIKQCTKAIKDGQAERAYLAKGVAPDISEPFVALCARCGVPLVMVSTKKELGQLCCIDVAASVAVILKSEQ